MADITPLFLDGDSLKNQDGQLVATLSHELDEEERQSYAGLLVIAPEMLQALETLVIQNLEDWQNTLNDARKRVHAQNRRPLTIYESAEFMPTMPEPLKQGLTILARAKGNNDENDDDR